VLNLLIIVLIYICLFCILSLSLNLIAGYTGLLSLCHASFMSIGAYTTAIIMTKFNADFLLVLLLSGILASFFGIIIGLPTLRLKGDYLAIATLGFGEIVVNIIINWESLTRGARGIHDIPTAKIFNYRLMPKDAGILSKVIYFLLILIFLVLTYAFISKIIKSRFGRALEAIREDEIAAVSMGINITKYKVFSFAIGAFFAGIAGSLFSIYFLSISPGNFTFNISIMILCIVVLGGMGNNFASILGALIVVPAYYIPQLLNIPFIPPQFNQIIFGLILVLMMIFRPQGLLGRKKPDFERIIKRKSFFIRSR